MRTLSPQAGVTSEIPIFPPHRVVRLNYDHLLADFSAVQNKGSRAGSPRGQKVALRLSVELAAE